jgi:hypothetical protein
MLTRAPTGFNGLPGTCVCGTVLVPAPLLLVLLRVLLPAVAQPRPCLAHIKGAEG